MSGPGLSTFGQFLARLMGGLILVFAVLKAWTPASTVESLAYVSLRLGLGTDGPGLATLALVAVETALGLALLLAPSPRLGWVGMGLFIVFAGYAGWLIMISAPVGCGCGVPLHIPGVNERWMSVGRALGFAAVLCPLWYTKHVRGAAFASGACASL